MLSGASIPEGISQILMLKSFLSSKNTFSTPMQTRTPGVVIQHFAEVTLAVRSDRCTVHYEVTRVTQKLVEGMLIYIIPTGEFDDEDDDLLQVGMCVLTRIYMFLGSYAIIQFVTLSVEGQQVQRPVFWIHTDLLQIPLSRIVEAHWARTLFPGFIPSIL